MTISTNTTKTLSESDAFQHAKFLVGQSGIDSAIEFCQSVLVESVDYAQLTILLSQFYQQNGLFDKMLALILKLSKEHNHQNILVNLRKCECLIYCSETKKAIELLDVLSETFGNNDKVISKIAELYIHCSQHKKVALCHQKALNLKPNYSPYLYNLSFSKLTLGKIDQASKLLRRVIIQSPTDFDAYYSRSILLRASSTSNHIEQLERLKKKHSNNPQAQITLGYALGKEFEDTEAYGKAFKVMECAATVRRKSMQYQVKTDVDAMQAIQENFSRKNLEQIQAGTNSEAPIFILGLPRSGTTLVEQILSSHSEIDSLGEISSFAFSLIHSVGQNTGKMDLINKSITIDMTRLGQRYVHAIKGYGKNGQYLIDKTPLNFLYIGLIKKALPQAKIIHLSRHPLDSCFAMFKTLFRMGYPFSYSLDDLAQYYVAYHQLMNHWRSVFDNRIFDLSYQSLVESPEDQIKNLLNYCQLEWQPEVMEFHRNKSPSATASASQIRQPIYKSSVQKWRYYETQLSPLKSLLESNGINCD
ncbi:MAG: sulfotransferase [Kangiellaceae bacterium]|nr:sulfotransferase [Kangiellaceae bacterium]